MKIKKLFVFRLNGVVQKVEGISIAEEAEVLYQGSLNSVIPPEVQDLLEAEEAAVSKLTQEKAAYDAMVSDIYAEMLNVFDTKNDVSAQAFAATYEAMAKRPANYVGQFGLVDEAAVVAYADTKIAAADTYAIFRMNRIAQYQAEKLALNS